MINAPMAYLTLNRLHKSLMFARKTHKQTNKPVTKLNLASDILSKIFVLSVSFAQEDLFKVF